MPNSLLVAVDVGNTAASCAVFRTDEKTKLPLPRSNWIISTKELSRGPVFQKAVRSHFRQYHYHLPAVKGVIISSVVPSVDAVLRSAVKQLFGFPPYFVNAQTPSPVKVKYQKPSEVGADRLVNARAAVELGAGPSIVIDFGTATTFDCISARKEYLGGVIAPGPVISAEALYQKTAKLPMVILNKPARILGRDTLQSIQSGLYHGYRGLVKEVVLQLTKTMGSRTKVYATGGQAHWILGGLKIVDKTLPFMTLSGLFCLWKDIHHAH